MHTALHLIFALSALWLVYTYFGYPAILFLLTRHRTARRPIGPPYFPTVTLITSAFNEERVIGKAITNKLDLDYPIEKLEIVVVSDASTDDTDQIVEGLACANPGRVRLIRQFPRQGKTTALNRAAAEAHGEILVFADANSLYEAPALRNLVRNFADSTIGYATGRLIYSNPDGSVVGDGCTAYMRYENRLRGMENKLGTIVGVDGGIDAVPKTLYKPMRADQLPDLVLPLHLMERGYRIVYVPDAVVMEPALGSTEEEYWMRVRVALRSLWALRDLTHLFNPFRFPRLSWQLVSHKLLRYMAFFPQLLLLVTNSLLVSQGPVLRLLLFAQIAFYFLAAAGYFMDKTRLRLPVIKEPYYLSLLNLSCGHAFVKFLLGQRQVIWRPRTG